MNRTQPRKEGGVATKFNSIVCPLPIQKDSWPFSKYPSLVRLFLVITSRVVVINPLLSGPIDYLQFQWCNSKGGHLMHHMDAIKKRSEK